MRAFPTAVRVFRLVLVAQVATGAATPDAIERERFRLLNEALTQAESPRADWDPGQRDCAGFVRFLYRKATLGSSLWRDKSGRETAFVTADELLAYNFSPISRAPMARAVETGDLLAFYNPDKTPSEAWHLMLLLRPPGAAPDRVLVVYHNGAAGEDGAVRKVWLEDLISGPPQWRPVAANPRFLGTFRWNVWRSGLDKER